MLTCILTYAFMSLNALYWALNINIVLPTVYLTNLLFILPLRYIRPRIFWTIEQFISGIGIAHFSFALKTTGVTIYEYGDDISQLGDERCLVVANHQAFLDTFALWAAFDGRGTANDKCVWLLNQVRYLPVAWCFRIHGIFFLRAGRDRRHTYLASLRRFLRHHYWSRDYRWLVVFPEGARLYRARPRSHAFAAANGLPRLERVALPKYGALKTMLSVCGPSSPEAKCAPADDAPLTHFIDVTVAYRDGAAPSVFDLALGKAHTADAHLHYSVFDISSIPGADREKELEQWILDRWLLKERVLQHFHEHGTFPGASATGRPLTNKTWLRFVLIESYWLSSFVLYVAYIYAPLISYVLGRQR